jgi:putative ABC transport system ATP-binding protein
MSSNGAGKKSDVVIVQGIERTFGSGETAARVLRGVDLNVEQGQLIALYGPSGSGKTTLLNLIGALDLPTAGHIEVAGQDITRLGESARTKFRRSKIGFIFQNYTLLPTYTALENIDLTLRLPGLGFFERRKRAKSALAAVGLSAWASHIPDELSGGQRQRVAIARALALQPALILADEPTSGLDTRAARRTLALFRGIAAAQHTTFIIVSHDPMIAEFVDIAYDLNDGRLVPHLSLTTQIETKVSPE